MTNDNDGAGNLPQQPQPGRPVQSEPIFNIPNVILGFLGACIGLYIAQIYLLSPEVSDQLLVYLAFIPARFSQYGGLADPTAWWTPVSYSLLHGSFAHLAVNMVWLAAFGSPLAGRIGALRTVIFWIVTALAAALTHYAIHQDSLAPLVGASGAISGMMGAAARFGFRRVSRRGLPAFGGPLLPVGVTLTLKPVLTFLGVWFVINIVTGLLSVGAGDSSSIAWEAHIGGFVAGFFGISLLDKVSERATR